MKSGKNIGDVFKDNLYDYSEQASSKVWENIQSNPDLIKYNKNASFSYVKIFSGIAAVAMISVVAYFAYNYLQAVDNVSVVENITIVNPIEDKSEVSVDEVKVVVVDNEEKKSIAPKENVIQKKVENIIVADNAQKNDQTSTLINESENTDVAKNIDSHQKTEKKQKIEHQKDSPKTEIKSTKELIVAEEKPRTILSVNPVSASNDTIICRWSSVNLSVLGAESVVWADGQIERQITVSPTESSVFAVRAIRNDGTDTLFRIFVQVVDCHQIHIPTAFTPDGDGRNDEFKPVYNGDISDFEMLIFTRNGRKVFESRDVSFGWDGRASGSAVEEGAYFYVIRYRDASDKLREQTGQVILYRSR
jgi:gliding motility-associated-like protein